MTKLNLGSGTVRIDGFTNVDHLKLDNVDIVCDVSSLYFADDNSIEAIYASNVIEHYPIGEINKVLKEWLRVLIPGGKLMVSVPDMMAITEYINRNNWNEWINGIVYGDGSVYPDLHKCGFSFETLYAKMVDAGYRDIFRVEKFGLSDTDCSNCKARDGMDNYSYSMVLNVVGTK